MLAYVRNLYQYLQGELASATSLVIILFLLIVALWEKQARQVTRSTIILGDVQSLENREVNTQEQVRNCSQR